MLKRLNQSQGFFEMPFHCIFFFSSRWFWEDWHVSLGSIHFRVGVSVLVCPNCYPPPTPASLSTDSVDTEVVEIACLFWMRQPVLKQSLQNPGLENFRERALGAPVTMRSVSRVFFQGDIHSDCLGRTVSI